MKPLLITFSGVDGSGKSTQIARLEDAIAARGLRVRRLGFWDNIVVLTRFREGFVHKVYKSERGIGAPGKPVARRDKNMRGWHLTLARHALYLLDAVNLRRVIWRARRSAADILILDRYIYDQLANLPLENLATRSVVRLLAAIAPHPDLAFVLDADPESARARKPEYPVDYIRQSRESYLRLAHMLRLTVIPPLPLDEAAAAVEAAFVEELERIDGSKRDFVPAA